MPFLIFISSLFPYWHTPVFANSPEIQNRVSDTTIIDPTNFNRKKNTKELAEGGNLGVSNKINKGVKAIISGDAKNAIKQLQKVSKKCDDYWKVLNARGVLLMAKNQPHSALKLFYEALKLEPTDNHLLYNIALANLALGNYQSAADTLKIVSTDNSVNYHQALALAYYKSNQIEPAKKILEQAIQQNTTDPESYTNSLLNHAHLSIKQGDFDAALASLDKIEDKSDPVVALACGICYEKKQDWNNALKYYLIAQQNLARNKSVLVGLTHTYKALADPVKANQQLRKLGALYPDDMETGIENLKSDNPDPEERQKTIDFYKRILYKDPVNIQALNSLGMYYSQGGNFNTAKNYFSQVLSLQPDNVVALYGEGICEFNTEDYNSSIEHLNAALQYAPNFEKHQNAEFLLGLNYDAQKKFELSVNKLKKAGALTNPTNEITRLIKIGIFYLRLKKFKDAITYFQTAHALDAKSVSSLVNRGSCYFWMGDFDAAKKDFERAIALDPKCHQAWSNLGLLNCQLKNNAAAVENLKTALKIDTNNVGYNNTLARAYSALLSDYRDLNPTDSVSQFFKLAMKTIKKVMDKDPTNVNFINNKGVIFKDNLQYDSAIVYYKKSQTQAGLNNIGIVKALQFDTFQSKRYFDNAVEADAGFSIPRHNKALMSDFMKNNMEARVETTNAEKLKAKEALTKNFKENFISIYYVETAEKNQSENVCEPLIPKCEPESLSKPIIANYYVHGSYIVCDEIKDYKTPKWHSISKPTRRNYFQFMSGKCPKF